MTSDADLFAPDFKTQSYWWDQAKPAEDSEQQLPAKVDVAIIGAGYSGLQAAVQTARAGQSTLVLDAEAAGWGCSTRNGGQISTSIKPDLSTLERRYGSEIAKGIIAEGKASLKYIQHFVESEAVDCDFHITGRFHGAHTRRHYDRMARECSTDGLETFMVPRAEQHTEIATDYYHGGMVYPHYASINPGLYHQGLTRIAQTAGAQIISYCRVNDLTRNSGGFALQTAKGMVQAERVIIATNGYTGALTPWHQRRVIPIGSYIIATQEISPDLMDEILPTNRMMTDTRKLVYYYRPSPDRKRILFGGRVSLKETDPLKSGPKLHREMLRLLPQLAGTRISHSWNGFVAYTFDELMHVGHDKGLHYAMGYCGSGVGIASYLGMRLGQQAAGIAEGRTPFDQIPFPSRPFYQGNPWFLAPSILAYRLRDRLGI